MCPDLSTADEEGRARAKRRKKALLEAMVLESPQRMRGARRMVPPSRFSSLLSLTLHPSQSKGTQDND